MSNFLAGNIYVRAMYLVAAICLFSTIPLFAQVSSNAVIDSLWSSEETSCDGENVVTVCFILSGGSTTVNLRASSDSGATWTAPAVTFRNATGDLGAGVNPGTHCFDWVISTDLPNVEGYRFRLQLDGQNSRLWQKSWAYGSGQATVEDRWNGRYLRSDSLSTLNEFLCFLALTENYNSWIRHTVFADTGNCQYTQWIPFDYDADGDLDIVGAIGAENKFVWYENQGAFTFVRHDIGDLPCHPTCSSNTYRVSIDTCDVNQDGHADWFCATNAGIYLFMWTGTGTYTRTTLTVDQGYHFVDAVYKDGQVMVLASDNRLFCYIGVIKVFVLNPTTLIMNETWNSTAIGITSSNPEGRRCYWGDFNADGLLDFTIDNKPLRICYATSADYSSFRLAYTWHMGSGSTEAEFDGLAVIDFDHDKDLDVVGSTGEATSVYPGEGLFIAINQFIETGRDSFILDTLMLIADLGDGAWAVDLDQDGKNDVVTSLRYGAWLRNTGSGMALDTIWNSGSNLESHWVCAGNFDNTNCDADIDVLINWNRGLEIFENQMISYVSHGELISSVLHLSPGQKPAKFGWADCVPAGVTISYYFRSGATVAACSTAAWTQVLSSGAVVTGPRGGYAQYRLLFARTSASADVTPRLDSLYLEVSDTVNSIFAIYDTRRPTVTLACPDTISPNQTVTFNWSTSDRYLGAAPCSLRFAGCGMDQRYFVTGNSYLWTSPSNICASCTLFVSARDSFCNWGRDTCTFASLVTLDVISAHGAPVPSVGRHYYSPGSVVTASVDSVVRDGAWDYYCSGYQGTGNVPARSYARHVTFTLNTSSTITWLWIRSDSVLTLDVCPGHDSPEPPVGRSYVRIGETVNMSCANPIVTERDTVWTVWGARWAMPCTAQAETLIEIPLSITMTDSACLCWLWMNNFQAQCTLWVQSCGDTPEPGAGRYQLPCGYNGRFRMDQYFTVLGDPRVPIGAARSCAHDTLFSYDFRYTLASRCTLSWICGPRSNWVILTTSGAACATPCQEPLRYYPRGATVTLCANPTTGYAITGWDHGYGSVPLTGIESSFSVTLNADSSHINWICASSSSTPTLVVRSDCQATGMVPRVGTWHPPLGSNVHATHPTSWVVGSVTYQILGSYVSCATPQFASGAVRDFTPGVLCTLQWVCTAETNMVALTVNGCVCTSGFSPQPGIWNFARNSVVNITAPDSCFTDGHWYLVYGWEGTGNVPAIGFDNQVTVSLNQNSTINWLCVRNDSLTTLTVSGCDGCSSTLPPLGVHRLPLGYELDLTTCAEYITGGTTYYNVGYRLTVGHAPFVRGFSNSFALTISDTTSVLWLCTSTPETLQVSSCGDTPWPPDGITRWMPGEEVCAAMDLYFRPYPPPCNVGVCMGWWGSGSAPAEGGYPNLCFNINQHSAITWLCGDSCTNVYLDACETYPEASQVPPPGRNWFTRNQSVGVSVITPIIVSGQTTACTGHTGTGSITNGAASSFSFNIALSSSVCWTWDQMASVTIDPPPWISHDTPKILRVGSTDTITASPGFQYLFPIGSTLKAWVNHRQRAAGITWLANGWRGIGDSLGAPGHLARTGPDTLVTFRAAQACTLWWSWIDSSLYKTLEVISDCGIPNPHGTNIYLSGTSITATMDTLCQPDSCRKMHLTGWTRVGSQAGSGIGGTTIFTINQPTTLTWLWHTEYRVSTGYTGNDDYIPHQVGDGWYDIGDTVTALADTAFYTNGYWHAFQRWAIDGPIRWLGTYDSISTRARFVVLGCVHLTAIYVPAVSGQVRKDPFQTCGDITVNDRTSSGVGLVRMHWAVGTRICVAVSPRDSCDIQHVYQFRYWWNDTTQTDPTLFCFIPQTAADSIILAHYDTYRFLTITRRPATVPFNLFLAIEGDTLRTTGSLTTRVIDGNNYTVAASPGDSSSGQRWLFDHWTSGATTPSYEYVSGEGANVDTAVYVVDWGFNVVKSPAENFGWIRVGAVYHYNVSSFFTWQPTAATPFIGVSCFDPDTIGQRIYRYSDWSDGGLIQHTVASINGPTTVTANYSNDTLLLCFGVTPTSWDILPHYPPGIDWDTLVNMAYNERMLVTNCGNVPVILGLQVVDTLGNAWFPGISNSVETYRLRAMLADRADAPAEGDYGPNSNIGRAIVTWANGNNLGPGGFPLWSNVTCDGAGDDDVMLFFQLLTPSYSWQTNQVIKVRLIGRVSMP